MNSVDNRETNHDRTTSTGSSKHLMTIIRQAIIGWWKRKRSFYVRLQQQKDSSSTGQQLELDNDNRIGVMKLIVDWTVDDDDSSNDLNSNEMRSDCSISSSSSSQFDVTSISSNNEPLPSVEQQSPLLNPLHYSSSDDEDSHEVPVMTPVISQPKTCQQYVSQDVSLVQPFPFLTHQSYSAASIVSIDSISASNCWDLDDSNDNSYNVRTANVNGQEPYRFCSTSASTTDETDTNSSNGQLDLFKQHVQFLENRTQPQQVREYDACQFHSSPYIPYSRKSSRQKNIQSY
jgi:hypothetical protein